MAEPPQNDAQSEQPVPTTLVGARRRSPNPRPLLILIFLVGLGGGSCTLQAMMGAGQKAPTREEVTQLVHDLHPNQQIDAATADRLAAALKAMWDRAEEIGRAYRPFVLVFGTLLVAAYCFAAGLALKAFRRPPGVARALVLAATLVLPARVAFAAIEFAVARAVEPVIQSSVHDALRAAPDLWPAADASVGAGDKAFDAALEVAPDAAAEARDAAASATAEMAQDAAAAEANDAGAPAVAEEAPDAAAAASAAMGDAGAVAAQPLDAKTEQALEAISHAYATGASAMPIVQALLVCMLFGYARRYFRREDVVEALGG